MGLEVQEDGQNGNLNHIQSFQLQFRVGMEGLGLIREDGSGC